MTPQEQQLLQGLADRVNRTTLTDKDPEAEQFLQQSLGRNPDAVYILAQTVLVQQYALDQAKKQLDDLRQQAQQQLQAPAPQKHTSFLGNLLGISDQPAPPPPPPAQYAPVNAGPQPVYAPSASYGQQPYGTPSYGGSPFGGSSMGGGSFLGGAMQTAAGVAAGALAFEGIEDLLHGFGHHAGYGSGFDGGFGGGQPREEVVNNYYGDSAGEQGRGRDDFAGRLSAADGDSGAISPDIEDRRGDTQSFADTGDTTSSADDNSNDFTSTDDSSSFDSGSDDAGSFDDSSSSDDSSTF